MKLSKNLYIVVVVFLCTITNLGFSKECETVETNSIALSFAEFAQSGINPSKVYMEKIGQIKDLAKNLKLKNFNVTTTNTSVNKNTYGPQDQVEIYISVTLEFDYYPKALDSFINVMKPSSISMATANYEDCDHCKMEEVNN